MKSWNVFLAAILLTTLTPVRGAASATNVYIAQTATGSANGSSCANAYAVTFFNTPGNWGSGASQIGAGTTAHLCGTITSELRFSGGGTTGSVIGLLFETGASIQITPGCDGNGCINLGAYSYILIDGGASQPCGWSVATNVSEGLCNGQIENMLYGSSDGVCPGGACTIQATSSEGNLIQGNGGSNIEIRNLQVGPSYVHTKTGNGGNDTGGTQGIYLQNGSNWTIHDNKLHDAAWHTVLSYQGGGTYGAWAINNNEMYNNSHMVAVAGSDSSTLNGMTMTGNYTHDMSNWDTSSDTWHANAIHTYGDTTSTLTNQTIANNIMGGNPGADMTSQIFSESQKANAISNVSIYNNLIYAVGGLQGGERLILYSQCDANCLLVNNTLYGNSYLNGTCLYFTGTYDWTVENNAAGACDLQAYASGILGGTVNYNAYFRGNALLNIWDCAGAQTNTWATWRSCSGEGSNSLYILNNATGFGLNATYIPASGSPLIGAGANLTSLGISALNSDLAGAARPASGPWVIGAYSLNTSSPSPLTSLKVVVQ